MLRLVLIGATLLALLVAPASADTRRGVDAGATTATLHSVGHEDRHPTATFSGAETIYAATSPQRASDGSFLQENIAAVDLLSDGEIAAGQWFYESQLDPGTYWLLATDYLTYSEPVLLEIPKPKTKFKAKIEPGYIGSFELTASPLGESLPYKLCWTRSKGRKCLRASVDGYDWNEAASDSMYLTVRDLRLGTRRKTTFVWYVAGERVASKRVRISQG